MVFPFFLLFSFTLPLCDPDEKRPPYRSPASLKAHAVAAAERHHHHRPAAALAREQGEKEGSAAAGRRRRCRRLCLSLSSLSLCQKTLLQLSDAFSLPLAEATAAVDRHSTAVDAFFDGKTSSELGENLDNSDSLSWFYQPRATAATATAATAELFLSDPSVKKTLSAISSYASLLSTILFSNVPLFTLFL